MPKTSRPFQIALRRILCVIATAAACWRSCYQLVKMDGGLLRAPSSSSQLKAIGLGLLLDQLAARVQQILRLINFGIAQANDCCH